MRAVHVMPFGAAVQPGGGTSFRLWAPAARRVELALGLRSEPGAGDVSPHLRAAERMVPARRMPGGWWRCAVDDAGAGTLYRWRIDGDLLVPDPASRSNPLGVHGPSAVVDPARFVWDAGWRGRPWAEVVLYELHVGAFTREGTFAAAEGHLPRLAELGVTAVELMPLAAFPGRFGWGYDGVLPFAPHAAYGSPDELKHFIQAAHRAGLMVFLDVVYNHFGPDGNFLPGYAPDFFSRTRSSPWGAAIAFDEPGSDVVRAFFIHNALHWVEEYRVDGLRLDAVHAIEDRRRPDVLQELSAAVRAVAAAAGRHVHLVLENERNEDGRLAPLPLPELYDGQWNDDFHHALHVALTGERNGYYADYGGAPLELLARALTHGMLFEGSPRRPGGARERVRAAPPQPLGAMVNCITNHDQAGNRAFGERLTQLVPAQAAPLAALLALLTPATPMLFFGDEVGATEPFLYFADWEGELREAVREGRRREFAQIAAAGGDGGRELPDPCSAATFEASRPHLDPAGSARAGEWWELTRRALAARRQWIVPRQAQLLTGRHAARRTDAAGLAVRWRYADGHALELRCQLGPGAERSVQAVAAPLADEVEVFAHGSPDAGAWPAWSARWTFGREGAP